MSAGRLTVPARARPSHVDEPVEVSKRARGLLHSLAHGIALEAGDAEDAIDSDLGFHECSEVVRGHERASVGRTSIERRPAIASRNC
jgi:hypothetical protein